MVAGQSRPATLQAKEPTEYEIMTIQIEAIYEHGILRPMQPLHLAEGEKVALNVITRTEVIAKRLSKTEREAKDLEIINRNADRLNEEAMDVLQYQIEL